MPENAQYYESFLGALRHKSTSNRLVEEMPVRTIFNWKRRLTYLAILFANHSANVDSQNKKGCQNDLKRSGKLPKRIKL